MHYNCKVKEAMLGHQQQCNVNSDCWLWLPVSAVVAQSKEPDPCLSHMGAKDHTWVAF